MSEAANAFISRCSKASPSERANSQLFLSELCDLIGVAHPDSNRENGYGFEYQVTQSEGASSSTLSPALSRHSPKSARNGPIRQSVRQSDPKKWFWDKN